MEDKEVVVVAVVAVVKKEAGSARPDLLSLPCQCPARGPERRRGGLGGVRSLSAPPCRRTALHHTASPEQCTPCLSPTCSQAAHEGRRQVSL